MKTKLLIIEDDPHIQLGLKELLESEGYEVIGIARGDLAVEAVQKHRPDLVVLDIMLPGASGYEICKSLRQSGSSVPILMLTAKSQELDKVVGLDLGADDYVTKPFGVREFLARIQALLRRTQPSAAAASDCFSIGPAIINRKTFQIQRRGRTLALTHKEMELLKFLHDHAGEVLSRDQLLNAVWGYQYFGTTRTLDQVIVQLRKKLGDDGHQPRHLLTVHGVGYRLLP